MTRRQIMIGSVLLMLSALLVFMPLRTIFGAPGL